MKLGEEVANPGFDENFVSSSLPPVVLQAAFSSFCPIFPHSGRELAPNLPDMHNGSTRRTIEDKSSEISSPPQKRSEP